MAKDRLKILIAGDSFAASWPNTSTGWPKLLEQFFDVTNIAQAGVGEYKILKQIKSLDLSKFDLLIVSHTSPFRIHTPNHPIKRIGLHENCDLIYTDLEANNDAGNKSLTTALDWFRYHYDEDYQCDVYDLLRQEINRIAVLPYLCLDHNPISSKHAFEHFRIDFSNVWTNNRGTVNHYSDYGNMLVFQTVKENIEKIL
jgi:hypothetical protein